MIKKIYIKTVKDLLPYYIDYKNTKSDEGMNVWVWMYFALFMSKHTKLSSKVPALLE